MIILILVASELRNVQNGEEEAEEEEEEVEGGVTRNT